MYIPATYYLVKKKKWTDLTFGLYESSQEQACTGYAYASMHPLLCVIKSELI